MTEEDPATDYIMIATGTGFAPYRRFIRRLFVEDTPASEVYKGEAWLFIECDKSDTLLYENELIEARASSPDNLCIDHALSHIQDKVEEYSDNIFNKLSNGAHIYFCGLKESMPGIQDVLKEVDIVSKGLDYNSG